MTMAEEMIIGGFVSKVISDIVDIPENPIKDALRNADKKKRDKNQTIETRIYQVTIDAIKEFTKKEYKGQDVLYDAAESIIIGFKNSNNNVEAVRVGLKMLVSQVTSETCEGFLTILQHEICMDENDILYKEISMIQGRQIFETMREGFDVSNKNDKETHKKLDYLIEKENGKEIQDAKYFVKTLIENRADEYAQRWNKNVFLNNFNEEDENAGVNIKLSEIYIEKCLPHYIWRTNNQSKDTLKNFLAKYIININEKKMLLILGQAGIGKSTLITWIIANLVEKKENILVYQYAADLNNIDWYSENILEGIFTTFGLKKSELEGKSLILDGFDEIYVKGDRERILHRLNQELEKKIHLKKFSLIITSRKNYLEETELNGIEYITLQAWDEKQIRSFCKNYEKMIVGKDLARDNRNLEMKIGKIIENKDIMGIPLILYMVLALNIDVEKSSSTVYIYDQVFSLKKGGIYDRGYDIEHRINTPQIKRHIHHISQRIAFWMFENNADKAIISQEKFEEICKNEMKESREKGEDLQRDTLIGNFFQIKHCEGKGTDELQFVHRSIYEYFTVIFFFESLHRLKAIEAVAGKLGEMLKDGHLSEQMLEFIKFKFDNIKGYDLSDVTREVFYIMLRDGMTYYTKERYKNVIKQERNIFSNILKIVGLWNSVLGKIDNKIIIYLQCNREMKLNLKGIYLDMKKADLSRVYLCGAKLSGANLNGANLSGADLCGADLREAKLSGVDLSGADLVVAHLNEADLKGANLSGAILDGAELSGADLDGADLREADFSQAKLDGAKLSGAKLNRANLNEANLNKTIFSEEQVKMLYEVYDLSKSNVLLSETNEILSYKKYCIKKFFRNIL